MGYGGGAELEVAVAGREPGGHFVLARVVAVGGREGLLPVQRLAAGAGTTQFTCGQVRFENTGTVRIESGVLQPSGGFAQSGIIEGADTLQASFTNNGTLRPDPLPGAGLTISGNLT